MKINTLLLVLLVLSLALNLIQWRSSSDTTAVIIQGKATLITQGGTDTVRQLVPVRILVKDTSGVKEVVHKADSAIAAIDSLPPAAKDSAKRDLFGKYQITVKDSLTENFVTIDPLAPIESRAALDSTRYRALHWEVPYTDTVQITQGPTLSDYVSAGAGATIGAALFGPPGAAGGAIVGMLVRSMLL